MEVAEKKTERINKEIDRIEIIWKWITKTFFQPPKNRLWERRINALCATCRWIYQIKPNCYRCETIYARFCCKSIIKIQVNSTHFYCHSVRSIVVGLWWNFLSCNFVQWFDWNRQKFGLILIDCNRKYLIPFDHLMLHLISNSVAPFFLVVFFSFFFFSWSI